MTSDVGYNHLPGSLSGPCRCQRYSELKSTKVPKFVRLLGNFRMLQAEPQLLNKAWLPWPRRMTRTAIGIRVGGGRIAVEGGELTMCPTEILRRSRPLA